VINVQTFETLESEVRGYIRSWPTVFTTAEGHTIHDEEGRAYLDFFAGAGALNYGHNHPVLIDRLIDYLRRGGVVHSLDMATEAKRTFLQRFQELVLEPRGMDYRVQFPGPTGTNAVEAALKLARKVKGRDQILGFTNAFHGMTLGSLSVTGNSMKRNGAGVPLTNTVSMPYDGFLGDDVDSIDYIERFLLDDGSGVELPAAVILETVQAEGGINVARDEWLVALAEFCQLHDILLVVDDIQVGCGRTGPFFSFERLGIEPDFICLSKSISGSGLPMALTLFKPEFDVWDPGEHNGTFRGNNAAFVTATAALETFWASDQLTKEVERKAAHVRGGLERLASAHDGLFDEVRGAGLIQGLHTTAPEFAGHICQAAFERGLLLETSGPESEVIKLLPPLIIPGAAIAEAFDILEESVQAVLTELGDDLLSRSEEVGR
jgi:diaminobutyrate-2-oxoglutarate transaminase